MAGSIYTNIRAQQVGFDNKLKNRTNPYVVETKTVERARRPTAEYTHFNGTATKFELLREYVYDPINYQDNYYTSYGLSYDNLGQPVTTNKVSSPINRYPSRESHGVHSGPGLTGAKHIRTQNIYDTKIFGKSTGPLSMDDKRISVNGDASTHVRPLGPRSKYDPPEFVVNPNKTRYNFDSKRNNY